MERVLVGAFMTALDMAGLSLSVLLLDAQRLARLDAPTLVRAPAQRMHPRAFMLWVLRAGGQGAAKGAARCTARSGCSPPSLGA